MPITITINNKAITTEPGKTVLEAARASGIYIPTLCYAPKLKPFGGCRMCVVEVEKMLGFPTACTVPVLDGMVVRTETAAVQAQRKETLALLLSEHPYTCLTCGNKNGCVEFQGTIRKAAVTTGCNYCPKNGQCEIQTVLDYVCLESIPYIISYRNIPVEQDDPFFDRDMNLCIVCGRCIRACNDVRHAGVLNLAERGDNTVVATASGHSLVEAGCQFCGSCVDACPTGALFDKKSKWEGLPETIVPTICPYCAVGCSVNVQTRAGRVIRAVGNDDGPTNDGEVCVRARFCVVDVVHSGTRLKSPMMRHGQRLVPVTWEAALDAAAQGLSKYLGDEIAVIGSATATNEELYLLQKLARSVLHTNNVALATSPSGQGAVHTMMMASATIRDLRSARSILVVGSNPFDSHPIVGLEIRHALSKGATLVTIDPRRTKVARRSSLWLAARPGTDSRLLSGLLKLVSEPGARVGLRAVAATTGVSESAMREAASILTAQAPVAIVYGSGIINQENAGQTVAVLRSLSNALHASLLGLPGEGNVVGAYDMGLHPALLPGYRTVAEPGRDYASVLDGISRGEIKAVYLAGDVPPLPEFAGVPFLVLQGIANNDLVKHASVVLPVTTFAEMDGTMTNLEGRVQRLRPVIKPVGKARPGWEIVQEVAQRLGAAWTATSAADVLAEIAGEVPAYAAAATDGNVAGALRRFAAPGLPAAAEVTTISRLSGDGEFPLLLINEHNLLYYRGASLTAEVKGLSEVKKESVVHISPPDAATLKVKDGQNVKVMSAAGSAYWIAAVDDGMTPGIASASVNPVVGSPIFPKLAPAGKTSRIRIEASE